MPFVMALLRGLVAIAGPLAIRVAAALGLGVAAFSGVRVLMDQLLLLIKSNVNSLGGDVLVFVGVFNLDRYITILFSAYIVRLVFMGLSATGVITRMQWRAPATGA